MKIEGKIIAVLNEQRGTSKTGKEWRKVDYVIQTDGQYPKKCVFSVLNEKIENFGLKIGQDVDLEIDIDAREYNGKWYNSITCWKAVLRNPQNNIVQQDPFYSPMPPPPQNPKQQNIFNGNNDQVPF